MVYGDAVHYCAPDGSWQEIDNTLYVNHFGEYRDTIKGSSTGTAFEWMVHNAGYYAFDVISKVCEAIGIDTHRVKGWRNQCRDVDIGATIFHDTRTDGAQKLMSDAMKFFYKALYPLEAKWDEFVYQCLAR